MFKNIGWAALQHIKLSVPGSIQERLNYLNSTLIYRTLTMNQTLGI